MFNEPNPTPVTFDLFDIAPSLLLIFAQTKKEFYKTNKIDKTIVLVCKKEQCHLVALNSLFLKNLKTREESNL